jgi:serine/threonine protein kinase
LQNIFVVQSPPSWWIKIGDFGISKRISNDDTALHTATGTPYYLAPEVHHHIEDANSGTGTYTNAVDIWSFGCVVYQIMALHVPFSQYPRNLVAFCKGGPFPEPPRFVDRTSREGIEFIKSVLVPLPMLRPSADEAMKSKWFRPEDNTRRSSLDQTKGQLDVEQVHRCQQEKSGQICLIFLVSKRI